MAKDFYSAIEDRRSIYAISKEQVVSDEKIQEVIYHAVKHTPSAFNSQSARVVVLLGEQHDKLWDITKETLRKIVPENNFASTEEKMNAFKSGYGTVLYFEDSEVVEELQEKFALYKENFQFGLSNPLECYNLQFGQLWKLKGLVLHCNITIH